MGKKPSRIPAVGRLVNLPELKALTQEHGREVVTYAARTVVEQVRDELSDDEVADQTEILERIHLLVEKVVTPSLKSVINATGVVLHTNLGRAPLGPSLMDQACSIVTGYSNLEFDLGQGCRGQRNKHTREILRFLTGAEDAVVVNNNAAAIILVLNELAKGKEVIISRGELIEIGGAFRIPDIMESGGAKMIEVGTTNKTRLSDYEKALTGETAMVFKAHQSNFKMNGFTEDVSLEELSAFAKANGILFVYDIGSGLLRKPEGLALPDEPDVRTALAAGPHLVTFSCDKLIGGPQGGVIAGNGELVSRIASNPLMRALRVGKLTIAALETACRSYLSADSLVEKNPAFDFLGRDVDSIDALAQQLAKRLTSDDIACTVVDSISQPGGGALPDVKLDSRAVRLDFPQIGRKRREAFVEALFKRLLDLPKPVVGIQREGTICFDLRAVFECDLGYLADAISGAVAEELAEAGK